MRSQRSLDSFRYRHKCLLSCSSPRSLQFYSLSTVSPFPIVREHRKRISSSLRLTARILLPRKKKRRISRCCCAPFYEINGDGGLFLYIRTCRLLREKCCWRFEQAPEPNKGWNFIRFSSLLVPMEKYIEKEKPLSKWIEKQGWHGFVSRCNFKLADWPRVWMDPAML